MPKNQQAQATAVALTESTDMMVPVNQPTGLPRGMETFSGEDLTIPRLRIVQHTSDEGTVGTFRLNLTGEEFTELKCVFLKATKGRVLFSRELKEGAICGSSDRIHPAKYFDQPMAESCARCEYADWDGKNKPQCSESYTLLGLDTESGIPFFFQTRSTAIQPTKLFLSGVAFKSRKLNADLCDFAVTLKLKEIKNDKGKYFVPVFDKPTYLKGAPYRDDADLYAREEVSWETEKVPPKAGDGSQVDENGNEIPF